MANKKEKINELIEEAISEGAEVVNFQKLHELLAASIEYITSDDFDVSMPAAITVLPEGAVALEHGRVQLNDGTIVSEDQFKVSKPLPEGAAMLEDGNILLENGTVISAAEFNQPDSNVPDGAVATTDGSAQLKDSKILRGDQSELQLPPGATLMADGQVKLEDGTIVSGEQFKQPESLLPPGAEIMPDGSVRLKDGTILSEDQFKKSHSLIGFSTVAKCCEDFSKKLFGQQASCGEVNPLTSTNKVADFANESAKEAQKINKKENNLEHVDDARNRKIEWMEEL